MPLNTRMLLDLSSEQTAAFDLASGSVPLALKRQFNWPSGTALNQADRIFHDTRTLAPSASESLDLAGVLTDVFGALIAFARVKALFIYAAAANTNNVVVGGAGANGFVTWVGGAAHTVSVRPGGLMLLAAPDATAYAVTAGTGDLLQVANSAAGTSVTYDVVIIGASA